MRRFRAGDSRNGAQHQGRAGVPDDIGGFIAALLADDHRWISGQRIEVSGGQGL